MINLLGSIVGGILVAALIMPKLYNAKTITIYGFIGERFGEGAKRTNSIMFLLGQLFTSGSRLFIAAIAVSVIIFGKIEFTFIFCSIIILGLISTFYTMMGGIKGLLYIDTFQTLLMTFTGVVALVMVYCSLEGFSFADIWEQLTTGASVYVIDESIRLDLLALDKYFNENGITHSFMTTQVGRQFALEADCKSLQHLSVGGEKLVPVNPQKDFSFYNVFL